MDDKERNDNAKKNGSKTLEDDKKSDLPSEDDDYSLLILKNRLAKGEISVKEFDELKQKILETNTEETARKKFKGMTKVDKTDQTTDQSKSLSEQRTSNNVEIVKSSKQHGNSTKRSLAIGFAVIVILLSSLVLIFHFWSMPSETTLSPTSTVKCYSNSKGPIITSVSNITASLNQKIIIKGCGFGNTVPLFKQLNDGSVDTIDCYGKTPSILIYDLKHKWGAGYADCFGAKPIAGDWIGVYLGNWTDTEIVLYGFGFSNLNTIGVGNFIIEPRDPMIISIHGPNHGGVYNFPATVVETSIVNDLGNTSIKQKYFTSSQTFVYNWIASLQQISKMPQAVPIFITATIPAILIAVLFETAKKWPEKGKKWKILVMFIVVALALVGLLLFSIFL